MAQERDPEDTQINRYIHFGMRLGISVALHPFEYSKTLIQVRVLLLCVSTLLRTNALFRCVLELSIDIFVVAVKVFPIHDI